MNRTLTFSLLAVFFLALFSDCSYVQKIRDGQTAFERKQYAVAADMLTKEYKKTKSRVEKGKIAFKIGESYRRMNQSGKSVNWYLTAYENSYGVDALKQYAYALKKSGQYGEAMDAFKNLGIEIGSPYEYRREITACQQAIDWQKDTANSVYKTEESSYNSTSADYAPVFYQDGQLIFTSDRTSATGEETYNWTGAAFSDLFLTNMEGSMIQPFDDKINSVDNEGTLTFNSDYTEIIFSRCFNKGKNIDNYCKLMTSQLVDGQWSEPVVLNFIKEQINYAHPVLSADEKTLYFSSDDDEGWGGYDIYVTQRSPDGWEVPRLLSRNINTSGNEMFPTLDADTLYFASDFHVGMGGLDIFKTYRMANGNWSPIQNLKPPVNSPGDDFALVVNPTPSDDPDIIQRGLFSSNRPEGSGSDDIYRFQKTLPPPPPPIDTTEPIVYKMILDGYVLEKIYRIPDNPNSQVLGRKPLNGASVKIDVPGKPTQTVTVGEDGLFTLELDEESDYSFLASNPSYLNNTERFSTKGIGQDPNNPVQKFEIEIVLDKIFTDKEIVLDNIYYDLDESFIRDDAKPTLNELARVLNENPGIKIQLASHTDCRGGDRYNEDLSQRRAQAAVDYLIENGIDRERLTSKGFGENVPAVDCACSRCTEEEHQANRRTTFKIIDKGI